MIGQTLGHYRIESKLGEGGMGVVYKARDIHLDRSVAIKVLPPEAVSNPERKRRFVQEAKAASALNHPNIITIYDINRDGSTEFIAMEYVEGKSLDAVIGRKGLKLSEALKYATQVADGLAAAHAVGIVHRDIKPSNLMVSEKGLVKVLDFGLAKLSEPAQDDLLAPTQTMQPRTEEGTIVGTVAYMSPEQAEGRKVDARSDVFSFGSVLYEMVTGRRPFQGETKLATLSAILSQEPKPVREMVPDAPVELERIITRCLRKDLDRRFHHMMDLKVALEELREESESGRLATPVKRARRTPPWAIAALAVAAIAVAGVIWLSLGRPRASPAPVLTQLTFDSGLTTDPALSPDGKLVAYASDRAGNGNLDIWMQQLATGQSVRLTQDPADESEPDFSPDGSRITFRSEREGSGVYVISTIGGEPRLIARQGRRPRFSPDGTQIAYWVGWLYMGKTFVAPAAGGPSTPVQPNFHSALYPTWSPDGKHLLFFGAPAVKEFPLNIDWWAAPREGGEAVSTGAFPVLLRENVLDRRRHSVVVPGNWVGDDVLFSARQGDTTNLWRIPVSMTGKVAGAPERLTFGTALETNPSVSPGGVIAFSNLSSQLNIWGLPIEANHGRVTGELQRITHSAHDAHTSLSADGKKLVFISTRSGNADVWLKDLTTGKETPLTATPQREEQPDITADGATISYWIVENERAQIHATAAAGGVPEKICENCGRPWDWSPDGRYILHIWALGQMKLGLADVPARQKHLLLDHPKYELARARFSPDGRWISLVAVTGLPHQPIVVVPFRPDGPAVADSEWIFVSPLDTFHDKPRWSPDGNLLYYTSDRDGYRCIRAQRLDPVTKRPVGEAFDVYHSHSARRSLRNAGIELMEISVGPDKMVFNLGEMTGNIWMAKFRAQP